eukprot:9630688-Lingulodinium_polyedra.AAC.1
MYRPQTCKSWRPPGRAAPAGARGTANGRIVGGDGKPPRWNNIATRNINGTTESPRVPATTTVPGTQQELRISIWRPQQPT